jgi:hypothetical protein
MKNKEIDWAKGAHKREREREIDSRERSIANLQVRAFAGG